MSSAQDFLDHSDLHLTLFSWKDFFLIGLMKDNVQMDATMAKRLRHMIRTAYYMLSKGFCKYKLILDLHLLLKHSKLAGKAITDFLAFHRQHIGTSEHSTFSCLSMDRALSLYAPKEVEFSCSNTPVSYPASFFPGAGKRRHRHRHRHRHDGYDANIAAAMVKALETLGAEMPDAGETVATTPSPASVWGFGKSPAAVRQLRITDSPFPVREEDDGGRADLQAEAFINRFYEQLRLQQNVTVTPEYYQSRGRKLA